MTCVYPGVCVCPVVVTNVNRLILSVQPLLDSYPPGPHLVRDGRNATRLLHFCELKGRLKEPTQPAHPLLALR